jgi:hypothetical protein
MSETSSFAIFHAMACNLKPNEHRLLAVPKSDWLQAWAGFIRRPDVDETPLSLAEIRFAFSRGLLNDNHE